jgi:hypothetical protein
MLIQHRLAIVFAAAIYVKAGLVIWHKRRHLDGFLNPLNDNPWRGVVTTDIHVTTTELRPTNEAVVDDSGPQIPGRTRSASTNKDTIDQMDPYTVNVEVDHQKPLQPAILRMRTLTREAAEDEINAEAWLYARVAILFFIALLITWVRDLSYHQHPPLHFPCVRSYIMHSATGEISPR